MNKKTLEEIHETIETIVADRRAKLRPQGIAALLEKRPLLEQWKWLEEHGHEFTQEGGESYE